MQNQNMHSWSWDQTASAPFNNGQPIPPATFTPSGVDQSSFLTSYQQMYGSSPGQPPADYGQWTSAQFQQWQQWQQWQEKYQQWQAQYGKKYAESLAAMGQNPALLVPGFPVVPPVRFPKPVDPVTGSSKANPPLPSNSQPVPPPPPEEEKPPLPVSSVKEGGELLKLDLKENPDELSEAEKTFDIQFKQWENEFEEWKKQNQDHPDKAQYREYEKKWEAWREQLLQRLEQMRKKRLEKANGANRTAKIEELKPKPLTTGVQAKSTDSDYGYRTQPPTVPQGSFANQSLKFDKPLPFGQSGASSSILNHRGHLVQVKNVSPDVEPNRIGPVNNNQAFHRNQATYGNFDHNLEGPNPRFANSEGGAMEGNSSQRIRNPGHFDVPRLGNADSFSPRRFEEKNFGLSARLPGDINRVERDFNRGFDGEKGPLGSDNRQNLHTKPKVPSLFDIQVERPPGLMLNDRKPKQWERHEDFEKKSHEAKPWNNSFWSKNAPSPWLQPWELEKMSAQKPLEVKPWERDGSQSEQGPWLKESSIRRDLDKAELSGYVGNILAKLGNVVPPTLGCKTEEPPNRAADGLEKKKWNEVFNEENKETEKGNQNPGESDGRNQGDQNKEVVLAGRGRELGERIGGRVFDRFDGSLQFPPDKHNLDVDDRVGDKFCRDSRVPFGRDEKDLARGGEPFFDRGPFGSRGGRDERGYGGRFSREDVDERYGPPRHGRRGFERFDRDEREGRGSERPGGSPFERLNRHERMSEPIWKPQIFDYSQGRPMRFPNLEEGFKISTVVDYSHGENKQTYDYGHGEGNKSKFEMKSFDYGHKADAPAVIDYGHGVDPTVSKGGRGTDEEEKEEREGESGFKRNPELLSPVKTSRSSRGSHRSRSRSPHSRFKGTSSAVSPPFKNLASRNRDRIGRPTLRTERNSSDGNLSPSDGDVSKNSFTVTTVLVEDLICRPGRESRPNKLVFIMRGLPGSGKTYVTKLIKDKEVELGGEPPRILSLDDYFMTEVEKETVDPETGRKVKKKTLEYEYEAAVEPHYRGSLVKAFKKTVSDGFFSFIIVDSVNEKTKEYEEMWSFAKQKGFQVYVAEMDNDVTVCTARNIHRRTEKEISDLAKAWEETPVHYLRLDVRSLIQSDAITEVEMEVVSDTEMGKSIGKGVDEEDTTKEAVAKEEKKEEGKIKEEEEEEEEDEPGVSAFVKSRWDQFENSEQNLDRLDGLKRRREGFHGTMEDYLQLPDDFDLDVQNLTPGKKRVRWADLEERKQQEKMRAIGFVVGQTDWSRMTDPTYGESALTRTKYI